MEIKISTGATLVPADSSIAKQLLAHGGVEVSSVATEAVHEPETKPSRKKKVVTE